MSTTIKLVIKNHWPHSHSPTNLHRKWRIAFSRKKSVIKISLENSVHLYSKWTRIIICHAKTWHNKTRKLGSTRMLFLMDDQNSCKEHTLPPSPLFTPMWRRSCSKKKYKWNIGDSTKFFSYFFLVKKWTIHHSIYKRVVRGVAFRVMIPKLYRHPKLQLTYSMSLRDILISVWLWNFDNLCKYLICPFL